jgi:predicted DNA-binding mobile mystery protein A
MSSQRDKLRIRQLDRKLEELDRLRSVPPPHKGWISEIRRALGMSARQLAARLNVSGPAVSQYEKGEVNGTMTLGTLEKVAAALGCEFVYALVPKVSLDDLLHRRARRVATKMIERTSHSMHLEQQEVSEKEIEKQIEDLTQQLLADRPRTLWSDHEE